MKLAIDIVQSLLLSKLEKDANFDNNKTNPVFWESLASILLDFEKNAKPLHTAIYSLELNDPEKIILKLSSIYDAFIKELAEYHILGTSSKAIDYLLESKNETFENEVQFFSNLEKAITKVERKKIKEELPTAYEKLTFELPEKDIELVLKKKEREALKEKMKVWDAKLITDKVVPVLSMTVKETKVISLSWIKYGVAACLVLGAGFWVYENQIQDIIPENTVVTTPNKTQPATKTNVIPVEPTEALAEVSTVSKSFDVKELEGAGFSATKTTKISVIENNPKARILSIGKAIEKYQIRLEKEFAPHKVDNEATEKELRDTIASLKKELKLLKERENRYVFDGKKLIIYVSTSSKIKNILLLEDQYYLYKDKSFYSLPISNQPKLFQKETDPSVLEALDRIISE
jgi:Skp family chaperone for outer membrane proteins